MSHSSPAEGVSPTEPVAPKARRPLWLIASDIRQHWAKPHFAAFPYLFALRHLSSPDELYGQDSALSIIAYFLSNATTWRGPDARRLKAELKSILKEHGFV